METYEFNWRRYSLSREKNEKFDLSEGDDSNLFSSNKLLNIARLDNNDVDRIENNIFEPTVLLETIISNLEILEKKVEVMENLLSKVLALGVAIEKN